MKFINMKNPFEHLNLSFSILLFLVVLFFGSCNNSNSAGDTDSDSQQKITVDHDLGSTSVPINPSKVVVLDLGTLETLDQLGIAIVGTGKTNLPNYLKKYEGDDSVADVGTLKEVNFEKIHALSPDLIIISGRLQDSYKELSEIAPTIFVAVDYADYLNSFEKNVRLLGQIFEKEEQVEGLLSEVQNKVTKNQALIKGNDRKGLIVLYNNGRFSAYGKHSRFGFIHDVMGVKPSIENLEISDHGNAISSEFIQETNPDYLFVIDRGAIVNGKAASKNEVENALIQQTNAYKNNKIIYLDPTVWYVSGGGFISVKMMIDDVVSAVQ